MTHPSTPYVAKIIRIRTLSGTTRAVVETITEDDEHIAVALTFEQMVALRGQIDDTLGTVTEQSLH